jgi:hypothetical protein
MMSSGREACDSHGTVFRITFPPPDIDVHILIHRTCNCDLTGQRVLADVNQLRTSGDYLKHLNLIPRVLIRGTEPEIDLKMLYFWL